jgi:hypothetical protein
VEIAPDGGLRRHRRLDADEADAVVHLWHAGAAGIPRERMESDARGRGWRSTLLARLEGMGLVELRSQREGGAKAEWYHLTRLGIDAAERHARWKRRR